MPTFLNPILATDSYKVSHYRQYPPRTEHVQSYFESRGGLYASTLMFGLQYYLQTALRPISKMDILEAEAFCADHFGTRELFNRAGWEHILKQHDGALPLEVRAIAEGTHVPTNVALLTVENTDPAVPWLTNYVETRLVQVWYPITVATLSAHCRTLIGRFLERTGTPADIAFKLHDFGFRGSTSHESAAIGGLAHLVNFKGTDTLAALEAARRYYQCPMAGFSIPAAEHSTIVSWGDAHEVDAYRNMLQQYPSGLVAVVSDSYDIYAAVEHLWGEALHDEVLARPGTLVIRPDSGYPPEVVHKCLDLLGQKFGTTTNAKGYKVLDPHVRLIQGDGVDPQTIEAVLANMEVNGWSADNIAFGMGGALLQQMNRDTCRFAFKCCNVVVAGVSRPVCKHPVGDLSKISKAGHLTTYRTDDGGWISAPTGPSLLHADEMLRTVWMNGQITVMESLDTIRARAWSPALVGVK